MITMPEKCPVCKLVFNKNNIVSSWGEINGIECLNCHDKSKIFNEIYMFRLKTSDYTIRWCFNISKTYISVNSETTYKEYRINFLVPFESVLNLTEEKIKIWITFS